MIGEIGVGFVFDGGGYGIDVGFDQFDFVLGVDQWDYDFGDDGIVVVVGFDGGFEDGVGLYVIDFGDGDVQMYVVQFQYGIEFGQ